MPGASLVCETMRTSTREWETEEFTEEPNCDTSGAPLEASRDAFVDGIESRVDTGDAVRIGASGDVDAEPTCVAVCVAVAVAVAVAVGVMVVAVAAFACDLRPSSTELRLDVDPDGFISFSGENGDDAIRNNPGGGDCTILGSGEPGPLACCCAALTAARLESRP